MRKKTPPRMAYLATSLSVAPDHPLLVVNLHAAVDARPFRTPPRQVQSIQNNLSLANMDYLEFASSAGADGVFRGF